MSETAKQKKPVSNKKKNKLQKLLQDKPSIRKAILLQEIIKKR